MCGIVGYVGPKTCVDIIVSGLKRLEYRGYDSAGVAVVGASGLSIARSKGKLKNLVGVLAEKPIAGCTGIGHTRWATHGKPSDENAHPHSYGGVAVVHNGIIENHLEHTRDVIYLEEGELALLTSSGVRIEGRDRKPRERVPRRIEWSAVAAEKEGHKHFMHKEIFEQPRAVSDTIRGRISLEH